MVEIPSNSNVSKTTENTTTLPIKKNIDSVVHGELKKRSKLSEAFIATTGTDIKDYILFEVLIPTIKKGIEAMINGGLSMLFWGNSKASSFTKKPGGIITYNNISKSVSQVGSNVISKGVSKLSANDSFSNLVLSTRGEAEAVIDAMSEILDTYNVVTVADMYDLADISVDNYLVNDYGWDSLAGAKVEPSREGWILKMPRASRINR